MQESRYGKIGFLFSAGLVVTSIFFAATLWIFFECYEDPRWRVFDFNSRQAAEGEIYNVAEVPAIKSVELCGERKLRFEFTPGIRAKSWTIRSRVKGTVVSRGALPEIPFPDEPYTDTFVFVPEGVELMKEIEVTISFYPKERYAEKGLSWPDNYYSPYSSVPFSLREPRSLNEWCGLPDDDPEVVEARRIMGNAIDMGAPPLERSGQVFKFIMDRIKDSGGTPTDEVQNASPLETYRLLSSGEGKGWCENRALVYYLFANAAGVKTRLVDIADKFGPLKLTGHYFCESWDPERCRWYLVDPQSSTAHVKTAKGRLLNTVEIKHLFDVDGFDGCSALYYDGAAGELVEGDIERYYRGNKGYFTGDIVLAFKFGYPKNKSYSRLAHFIRYPTLLYAPFALPRLYLVKQTVCAGFILSLIITAVLGAYTAFTKTHR